MEELFKEIASYVALGVEAAAVLIVAYGAIEAFGASIRARVQRRSGTGQRKEIWLGFGMWLVLALEFELGADSFAFTIFKLFQFEAERGTPLAHGLLTPRDFALILVSIALVTLFTATISHHRQTRSIAVHLSGRRSMAELVAALVSLFGLAVLLSTLFHW